MGLFWYEGKVGCHTRADFFPGKTFGAAAEAAFHPRGIYGMAEAIP
jgi:hypothetical protein